MIIFDRPARSVERRTERPTTQKMRTEPGTVDAQDQHGIIASSEGLAEPDAPVFESLSHQKLEEVDVRDLPV